jgi:hypothetical protein
VATRDLRWQPDPHKPTDMDLHDRRFGTNSLRAYLRRDKKAGCVYLRLRQKEVCSNEDTAASYFGTCMVLPLDTPEETLRAALLNFCLLGIDEALGDEHDGL